MARKMPGVCYSREKRPCCVFLQTSAGPQVARAGCPRLEAPDRPARPAVSRRPYLPPPLPLRSTNQGMGQWDVFTLNISFSQIFLGAFSISDRFSCTGHPRALTRPAASRRPYLPPPPPLSPTIRGTALWYVCTPNISFSQTFVRAFPISDNRDSCAPYTVTGRLPH